VKLSIIIVNYNVQYFLEQALLAVRRAAASIDAEVWVVDNRSSDGSVQLVREKFPEVQLIDNQDNVGFAAANNQAIRAAAGAYVLLLNPDTVVAEDTFAKCLAFMDAHPEAGALGVRMVDGAGRFLPESKRGFPTPWVAFCKTFGLSALFPKSKLFNEYHLGYLAEYDIHTVDVLAGAFMLLRRAALDKTGLLDETFFMYGEDIDLSYRIVQAGYKNYYFPNTTIIHYKGESTKKGSLNYVRVFYQAMIIFARKHFRGRQASFFVLMLQLAIYFRAFLTLITNVLSRIRLPLLDAAVMYVGLCGLKIFWAHYYYKDPDYFKDHMLYFNFPLYTMIWVLTLYFSGAYDDRGNLRRLVRGIFIGTVLIAAVYGFLDLAYRSSRAIIVLGMAWAMAGTAALRMLWHFIQYKNFDVGRERAKNLVIVGTIAESERAEKLLQQAQVQKNLLGVIAPNSDADDNIFLGNISQLQDLVKIYDVEEIIFCSKDTENQQIITCMHTLGTKINYKILPEGSQSIIGSSSKHTAGELYTIDVRFRIADPRQRRSKRSFDVLLALFIMITLPLQVFIIKRWVGLLYNLYEVLRGRKSWVGYALPVSPTGHLPRLLPGILSPADGLPVADVQASTVQRLNFLYARDYRLEKDWAIVWKGYRQLGRAVATRHG
jgi:GT2 family glycosyltransferase